MNAIAHPAFAAALALAVVAAPSAGQGQQAPQNQARAVGASADAPVMWGADSVIYRPDGASLDGRAEILQGDNRFRAERLDISTDAANRVTRIEASGEVFYVTPRETMRGDRAVYTPADDTVVITGDVILTQGDNVMTGARLTYNLRTETARMQGPSGGRVQGVFHPGRKGAD